MDARTLILGSLLVVPFLVGTTYAQTGASRPSPPPEICVNGTCANTAVAVVAPSTGSSGGGPIKWNPGHYMASDTVLGPRGTIATVQTEMDDINGYDNILGYRVLITWGALEPSEGSYNFSLLDAILNRLKTQYNKPKRLVLVVLPGPFGSTRQPSDGSVIPEYLQTSSVYGPSPIAGSYGWWGGSSGGYVAALYRPAVMDRMIALIQALGAHYDSEPYFEAMMFQEDAWMASSWVGASDYSDSAFVQQAERMLTAATAAFPHTSVIMENTWLTSATQTQNFELWMVNNRIAPGTADTVGQSAFNLGYATTGLAWGLQAYMGIVTPGSAYAGGDLRPRSRAMLDVEAMDISGTYYANWGAPEGFKPLDIISALNNTYQASHAFWTHFFGSENPPGGGTVKSVSPWSVWSNLAPVINSNPLTNTSYPPNYP